MNEDKIYQPPIGTKFKWDLKWIDTIWVWECDILGQMQNIDLKDQIRSVKAKIYYPKINYQWAVRIINSDYTENIINGDNYDALKACLEAEDAAKFQIEKKLEELLAEKANLWGGNFKPKKNYSW